ncbi:MAG: hypothetical protein H0T76_15990 [Nannocystis sp.]|nr:hypothetical protein [Nannocystis sp.]MBA3547984.1 hypothetical protein [Nannocystis sp.]
MSERDAQQGTQSGLGENAAPAPADDLQIVFTFTDAYFRESHAQWVAVVARNWRAGRLMIRLYGLAAVVVCMTAWLSGYYPLFLLGAVMLGSTLYEAVQYMRRRARWYRVCRSLPWYGHELRIVVRNGVLVQQKEIAGDPRFARIGSILVSPKGYIVRYAAIIPIETTDPEMSAMSASLYIPHRAVTPPIPKKDFAVLIGAS